MSDVSTDDLSAYLEGDLDDQERARVDAAVAADPALAAELEELRAMIGELGDLPELEAPAGLLAAVMAQVADLPIPVAEDPPGLAAAAGPALDVANDPPPERDNVVHLSWWLKGPAASAIAALLVVGVAVWLYGSKAEMAAPVASAVLPGLETADAEPMAAPAMTGSADPGDDALVAADEAEAVRERLRARAKAEADAADEDSDGELIGDATPTVARGTLDPRGGAARRAEAPPAPAPARAAAKPEARAVFVAGHEEDGDEVAALDEEESAGLEEVSFGNVPETNPRGGRATLAQVGDRAELVNALRARGWSVTPAGKGFQVSVPEGQEQALVMLLREHGTLSIESPMQSMADGNARLVVSFK